MEKQKFILMAVIILQYHILLVHQKKRPYKLEETITVIQDEVKDSAENVEPSISLDNDNIIDEVESVEIVEVETNEQETKPKKARQMTKKELFNELYMKYIDCKKKERNRFL